MSLYACALCNTMDDTLLTNFHLYIRAGKGVLCSACDPEIGEWHGRFPKGTYTERGYQLCPDAAQYPEVRFVCPAPDGWNYCRHRLSLDVSLEHTRALHRVWRALNDGDCPKCHAHRPATQMIRRNGEIRCPACNFFASAAEIAEIEKLFSPAMNAAVEIFEKWRQDRNERDIPGSWVCDACGFALTKNLLTPTGEVSTDPREITERCPNDGTVLRKETWKERALGAQELVSTLLDELKAAKAGH